MSLTLQAIFLGAFGQCVEQNDTVGKEKDFELFEILNTQKTFSFVHFSVFDDFCGHDVLYFQTTSFFTNFVTCFRLDSDIFLYLDFIHCCRARDYASLLVWFLDLRRWFLASFFLVKLRYFHFLNGYLVPIDIFEEFVILDLFHIFKTESLWWFYQAQALYQVCCIFVFYSGVVDFICQNLIENFLVKLTHEHFAPGAYFINNTSKSPEVWI